MVRAGAGGEDRMSPTEIGGDRTASATDGSHAAESHRLSKVLYDSGLVRIGAFRAAVDHPRFHDSGPILAPIFVFPGTSVVIEHEHAPPFVADPSVVTYYNRGQAYLRRQIDPRGDRCEWFGVRDDVLRRALTLYDHAATDRESGPFAFPNGPVDSRTYVLQRLVVRHVLHFDEPDALLVDETVLHILDRVATLAYARRDPMPASETAEARTNSTLAGQVRSWVLERFATRFTLTDIAEATGASVSQICHVFRHRMGTTIHRYREVLRLRRSLEMIADARDLTLVSLQLGYSSHSHMTASFHRAFRITPSSFRERVTSRRLREAAALLPSRTASPRTRF